MSFMVTKLVFFAILALGFGGIVMGVADDELLDERAVKRLEAASLWLITEATGKLHANPAQSADIQHELIERFRLSAYNEPGIDAQTGGFRYIMTSRGIFYDIEQIEETEFQKSIYEYWRISISSRGWATDKRTRCWFIVTRSTSRTEPRVVLRKEPQFFDRFETNGASVIALDIRRNLRLRYRFQPWIYRECFGNDPDLTSEEVVILRNGSYQLRPLD